MMDFTSSKVVYPGIGIAQISHSVFGKCTSYLIISYCLNYLGNELHVIAKLKFIPAVLFPGPGVPELINEYLECTLKGKWSFFKLHHKGQHHMRKGPMRNPCQEQM